MLGNRIIRTDYHRARGWAFIIVMLSLLFAILFVLGGFTALAFLLS